MLTTRLWVSAVVTVVTLVSCSATNGQAAPTGTADKTGMVAKKPNSTTKKPAIKSPVFVRSASSGNLVAAIHVLVNGTPVRFTHGEPVESEGRVLVPMRGVFERLGAEVAYDSENRIIRATRGETTVTLQPNAEVAEINGETVPLATPAQVVNGSAVVPLRFISEAFGAQVKWDPTNLEVKVETEALKAMELPPVPGLDPVFGMVTGLYPEANLMTMRVPGGNEVRVQLTDQANATRRTINPGMVITTSNETAPIFTGGMVRLGEQVEEIGRAHV